MSKDLPYFRFYPGEWTGGRIFKQPAEMKGHFIDILCRYWKNEGNYPYEEAILDFDKSIIDFFLEKKIITKENEMLQIEFMDEQVKEIEQDKKKKSKAGKASAKSRYVKPVEHNLTPVELCSTDLQHNLTDPSDCSANNINNNRSINNTNSNNNKKFIKPTLLEIKNYVLENKYNVEPEAFFDFYESKGWKVGNQPMKNWQAAVRTWHSKNDRASPNIANKLGVSQKTANNMQVVKGFLETRGIKVNAE